MKRDDDFLRGLLLKLEASDDSAIFVQQFMAVTPDDEKRNYHLKLLCDAKLMVMQGRTGYRMTSDGHDYLDAIRSDTLWEQTKAAVAEAGGSATLEIMKKLAQGFLKKQIEKHTDFDLS